MLGFDHIAIAASSLDAGVAYVEEALGVSMVGGGAHPVMGTHNRLLGLGDLYLEVIAIDPDADAPDHARWFDLDRFSGRPRLTNWICRSDDLEAAIKASPDGVGQPVALTRGDLSWRMVVPDDGRLPYNGAHPALMQWNGAAHPAEMLPDIGCRLQGFEVAHPEAEALQRSLAGRFRDARVVISKGEALAFRAEIQTPHGLRVLS